MPEQTLVQQAEERFNQAFTPFAQATLIAEGLYTPGNQPFNPASLNGPAKQRYEALLAERKVAVGQIQDATRQGIETLANQKIQTGQMLIGNIATEREGYRLQSQGQSELEYAPDNARIQALDAISQGMNQQREGLERRAREMEAARTPTPGAGPAPAGPGGTGASPAGGARAPARSLPTIPGDTHSALSREGYSNIGPVRSNTATPEQQSGIASASFFSVGRQGEQSFTNIHLNDNGQIVAIETGARGGVRGTYSAVNPPRELADYEALLTALNGGTAAGRTATPPVPAPVPPPAPTADPAQPAPTFGAAPVSGTPALSNEQFGQSILATLRQAGRRGSPDILENGAYRFDPKRGNLGEGFQFQPDNILKEAVQVKQVTEALKNGSLVLNDAQKRIFAKYLQVMEGRARFAEGNTDPNSQAALEQWRASVREFAAAAGMEVPPYFRGNGSEQPAAGQERPAAPPTRTTPQPTPGGAPTGGAPTVGRSSVAPSDTSFVSVTNSTTGHTAGAHGIITLEELEARQLHHPRWRAAAQDPHTAALMWLTPMTFHLSGPQIPRAGTESSLTTAGGTPGENTLTASPAGGTGATVQPASPAADGAAPTPPTPVIPPEGQTRAAAPLTTGATPAPDGAATLAGTPSAEDLAARLEAGRRYLGERKAFLYRGHANGANLSSENQAELARLERDTRITALEGKRNGIPGITPSVTLTQAETTELEGLRTGGYQTMLEEFTRASPTTSHSAQAATARLRESTSNMMQTRLDMEQEAKSSSNGMLPAQAAARFSDACEHTRCISAVSEREMNAGRVANATGHMIAAVAGFNPAALAAAQAEFARLGPAISGSFREPGGAPPVGHTLTVRQPTGPDTPVLGH